MAKINCINKNRKNRVDLLHIKKVAEFVLKKIGRKDAEVNIVIVSNQKIRAMNRKYLKIDLSTDVLSFWQEKGVYSAWEDENYLGDVIISSDKAKTNAEEFTTTFKDEITLYVIHGILHLIGYKDKPETERKKMKKKEQGLFEEVKGIIK